MRCFAHLAVAAACKEAAQASDTVRQRNDRACDGGNGEKVMYVLFFLEQKRTDAEIQHQKDQHAAHKSAVKGSTRAPKVHEFRLGVGGKCCVPVIKGLHQGSGIIAAAYGKQNDQKCKILHPCLKFLSIRKHAVQHKASQYRDHQTNIVQPKLQILAQVNNQIGIHIKAPLIGLVSLAVHAQLVKVCLGDQHAARLIAVLRRDKAKLLHAVKQACRSAVAYL